MRILVVDDDDACRFMLRDALASIVPREHIAFASDGDEAWWILTDPDRAFDLLILDLAMPRVNGLELLARLRQHPKISALPIILCTGTSTRQSVTEAVRLNVMSYVVKPFSPSAIVQKVEEIINQIKNGRTALA
ncbi:MAG TPA: response regulator [Opitutaceae bacterium]|nr:response regulator [Opitutaceae bacterium]